MFDKSEITVRAGRGGNGMVSFRREKFVPLGGPNGGDGGDGGDVVIRADSNCTNLAEFQYRRTYKAEDGGDGLGRCKHGRKGNNLVLTVPIGVVVSTRPKLNNETEVYDLIEQGQQAVLASGGKGGLGNTHFKEATNQAPHIAQRGENGEQKGLLLELKLIADVGIIGYPNAGKSSLLVKASAAKPKIADYPFTTLEPALGLVEVGYRSFVMAEIPGLIPGAHLGRGLGHDFLRHITRTKVLVHLVDGSSTSPVEDMMRINVELGLFDLTLQRKPQLVAVNKIDLADVKTRKAELLETFSGIGFSPLFVSAITGEGIPVLMTRTLGLLDSVIAKRVDSEASVKVFRPKPKGDSTSVSKEGETFVVHAPRLERIIAGSDLADPEVRRQCSRKVGQSSVKKVLEKAGILPGDRVRCGALEWRW